jgi:hypothetical protein
LLTTSSWEETGDFEGAEKVGLLSTDVIVVGHQVTCRT